jgi:hypothetical protein
LATNKNSFKKNPNTQNFNIVIICLKAKAELSNWFSKHHSTLAALTPIKLFVETLKFPENIFFKEKKFVKESKESERISKNIH